VYLQELPAVEGLDAAAAGCAEDLRVGVARHPVEQSEVAERLDATALGPALNRSRSNDGFKAGRNAVYG
jgi:hypothetical protein